MSNSRVEIISNVAQRFLVPTCTAHRQYEALRAYFVDGLSSVNAAKKFGYTVGSFQVMCTKFRQDPDRKFFIESRYRDAKRPAPKKDDTRDRVINLRKKNLSIYDIAEAITKEVRQISPAMVAIILKEEGFSRLPRRRDEERPQHVKAQMAAVADATQLDLTPRRMRTDFGGLFLFLPLLVDFQLNRILGRAQLPGSKMIPAGHAVRSVLALKLFGKARKTDFMSHVFDPGLGLCVGLNAIPKRSFLTEYSCRVDPGCYPTLMRSWFNAANRLGLQRSGSFDLDFHTIPYHGDDAMNQKHYVSKRSRRQKGVLAFLAQDAETRVFCYGNAGIRKEDQNDEILRFVKFWKQRTGKVPEELVFDSKLTTYANLNWLNNKDIKFITLRRRSRKMLQEISQLPLSAWRRIELTNVKRAFRNPRILDQKITLSDYDKPLRQITIADLGHDEPTLLLTNQMRTGPVKLVDRYARRMIIENRIEDSIDFFHMDALSSAVAMKVNFDFQLTLMASSLYRLLAQRIGNGYTSAKSRHIFNDFIDASATVELTSDTIEVRFQKRAHNPLLLAAGFGETDVRIPWLGGKRLRLRFG